MWVWLYCFLTRMVCNANVQGLRNQLWLFTETIRCLCQLLSWSCLWKLWKFIHSLPEAMMRIKLIIEINSRKFTKTSFRFWFTFKCEIRLFEKLWIKKKIKPEIIIHRIVSTDRQIIPPELGMCVKTYTVLLLVLSSWNCSNYFEHCNITVELIWWNRY